VAHRSEDLQEQAVPSEIKVWLMDMEPVLGLSAALARFCALLTPDVYQHMSPDATEALATVQGILWRLEHAHPEQVT
jgi:hypothetical protein